MLLLMLITLKKEPYQLSSIISPIFGLNHQKITTIPINIKKADSSSSTIEQYVDKKTKENIFCEKEVAYNNSSNLDNTRIAQIKKNREQQQIYDSLPSRYLEFRDKIFKELHLLITIMQVIITIQLLQLLIC